MGHEVDPCWVCGATEDTRVCESCGRPTCHEHGHAASGAPDLYDPDLWFCDAPIGASECPEEK